MRVSSEIACVRPLRELETQRRGEPLGRGEPKECPARRGENHRTTRCFASSNDRILSRGLALPFYARDHPDLRQAMPGQYEIAPATNLAGGQKKLWISLQPICYVRPPQPAAHSLAFAVAAGSTESSRAMIALRPYVYRQTQPNTKLNDAQRRRIPIFPYFWNTMHSQTLIFTKSSQSRCSNISEFWNKKSSSRQSPKTDRAPSASVHRDIVVASLRPRIVRPKVSNSPLPAPGSLTIRKRRIKRHAARLEVELLDELASLAGAVLAVHADVFPLDRQRPFVLHLVEARMISSKFTPPRPGERKSQPRRGSPKLRWLPRMPVRPLSVTIASLMCT